MEQPMHRNGGKKKKTENVQCPTPSTRLSPPTPKGSGISSSGSKRGPRWGILGAAVATGTPKPVQIHPKMAARWVGKGKRGDGKECTGTDEETGAWGW